MTIKFEDGAIVDAASIAILHPAKTVNCADFPAYVRLKCGNWLHISAVDFERAASALASLHGQPGVLPCDYAPI